MLYIDSYYFSINMTLSASNIDNINAHNINPTVSFIAQESNKILKKIGDNQDIQYTPACSFNIAISLMSYNENIFKNDSEPVLSYKDYENQKNDKGENKYNIQLVPTQTLGNGDITPKIWMSQSLVWYSQPIMEKIGNDKFTNYINAFNYGNKDISGRKDINGNPKYDGLIKCWLSNSLKISPQEQINFIQNFVLSTNSVVSDEARHNTKNLLLYDVLSLSEISNIIGLTDQDKDKYSGPQWQDWKLYGKVGSGLALQENNITNPERQIGCFVGWIEKDTRQITFASHYIPNHNYHGSAAFTARDNAINNLLELINIIEIGDKNISSAIAKL